LDIEGRPVGPADLRDLIAHLERRVCPGGDGSRSVVFELPGEGELLEAGLHPEAVRRLLAAPWVSEMVSEVLETPEFCEPEDSADEILRYARDVVGEYVRKRFAL